MKALGIHPREAERQLGLFKTPPPFISIARPAKPKDGIFRLKSGAKKSALGNFEKARRNGRFSKFVPASGAASRMFHLLTRFLQREPFSIAELKNEILKGEKESLQFFEFMESISRLAFFNELGSVLSKREMDIETLRREGRFREILEGLLLPQGLNYAQKPKALIKFHLYPFGDRTPFEEHLVEAAETVRDRSKKCRVHFTVSEEHQEPCRGHFMEVKEKYEKKYGTRFDFEISVQATRTNTLSVDAENRPFRDEEGHLFFRPSGHGALLENLNGLKGDLVYIKNIDNVTVENKTETGIYWKKVLGGYLVGVQEKLFGAIEKLNSKKVSAGELKEITRFAKRDLNIFFSAGFTKLSVSQKIRVLIKKLDRPIRVCGVVPNAGEPGGGPFWVREGGEETLQIVESAQINFSKASERRLFQDSTHFNPVDLVCGVRDWKGKPFDLLRFRNPKAVFISKKSLNGRELKALELPGLWNGAMAHWITLFVEVPSKTFNPVKTVFDLLKPAHQVNV